MNSGETVFDEVVGAKFDVVGSANEDSQPTSDGSCKSSELFVSVVASFISRKTFRMPSLKKYRAVFPIGFSFDMNSVAGPGVAEKSQTVGPPEHDE